MKFDEKAKQFSGFGEGGQLAPYENTIDQILNFSFNTLEEVQRRLGAIIYLDEELLRSIALSLFMSEFQLLGGRITLNSGFVANIEQMILIEEAKNKLENLLYIIRMMYPYELLLNVINKLITRQRYRLLKVIYDKVARLLGPESALEKGDLAVAKIRKKITDSMVEILDYISHSLWSGYYYPIFIRSTTRPIEGAEEAELDNPFRLLLEGTIEYGRAYLFAGRLDLFKEGGGTTTVRLLDGKNYLLGKIHDDTFFFELNLQHIYSYFGRSNKKSAFIGWEYDKEKIMKNRHFIHFVVPYELVTVLRGYGDDYPVVVFGVLFKYSPYIPTLDKSKKYCTDLYLKAVAIFDSTSMTYNDMAFSTNEADALDTIIKLLNAIYS